MYTFIYFFIIRVSKDIEVSKWLFNSLIYHYTTSVIIIYSLFYCSYYEKSNIIDNNFRKK